MTQLLLTTPSQYIPWVLTRRATDDTVELLASMLVGSKVDLNPDQVEVAPYRLAPRREL